MFNLYENTKILQNTKKSAGVFARTLLILTTVALLGAVSATFAQPGKPSRPEQRIISDLSLTWNQPTSPLDPRKLVANTREFPYSAIVKLRITFPDNYVVEGTGALIAANKVLTAEHLVYKIAHGGHFQRAEVMPGYSANYESCKKVLSLNYNHGSHQGCHDGAECDIAVLNTQEDVGCGTGWFGFKIPTASDLNQVYIAGYPDDLYGGERLVVAGGRANFAQSSYHNILSYTDIWTGSGQSGAPIFTSDYYIIGVHTFGTSQSNYGDALCNQLFSTIYNWTRQ
ncbi:MAG: trypsin-like serine protease [Pyrinomonadaceae bacterium]